MHYSPGDRDAERLHAAGGSVLYLLEWTNTTPLVPKVALVAIDDHAVAHSPGGLVAASADHRRASGQAELGGRAGGRAAR